MRVKRRGCGVASAIFGVLGRYLGLKDEVYFTFLEDYLVPLRRFQHCDSLLYLKS